MSLSLHSADVTWLSPDCSPPPAVPRRRSVRRKNATAEDEVLVTVTVDTRSAPFGPGWFCVLAVALTLPCASECSACRLPNCVMVACGLPSVLPQLTTSAWVDSQYTLRSTTVPPCLTSSSTK